MANYDSSLTGAQIEAALEAVNGLIVPSNNGKILTVENGLLAAKTAIEIQGGTIDALSVTANGTYTHAANGGYSPVTVNVPTSAVLQALSASVNGTYTPPSGVDGFSSVVVDVSGGGGSAVAVIRAYFDSGYTCTCTQGSTVLTSDTSGTFIFCLPSTGSWTLSCNGNTRTASVSSGDVMDVYMAYYGSWTYLVNAANDIRENGTSSSYYNTMVNSVGTFYDIRFDDLTIGKALLADVLHGSNLGDTNECLTFMLCGTSSSETTTGRLSLYSYGTAATSPNWPEGSAFALSEDAIESLEIYQDIKQCHIYYCEAAVSEAQSINTKSWLWSLNEVNRADEAQYMNQNTGNLFKLFTTQNKNGSAFSVTLSEEARTRTAPINNNTYSYTLRSDFSRNYNASTSSLLGYYPMFSI